MRRITLLRLAREIVRIAYFCNMEVTEENIDYLSNHFTMGSVTEEQLSVSDGPLSFPKRRSLRKRRLSLSPSDSSLCK
jgi:hypothetical protein